MANDHDGGYKLLFSHPEMVRDLLLGFVDDGWLDEADFSSLTAVPGSYVAQLGVPLQRHGDLVWKLRLKGRWLYIYLLLEFQSSADHWMALRMLVYSSLLYQDLVKRHELGRGRKLPPILPIVLYNGTQRWRAPKELAGLLAEPPGALLPYLPGHRYLLLDARAGRRQSKPAQNLVATLFALESRRTTEGVRRLVAALLEWLSDEEQASLRRSFAIWINGLLRRRMPDMANAVGDDLEEVHSMLQQTINRWFDKAEKTGFESGLKKGLEAGVQEGLKKGLRKGLREGRQKGRQEGQQQGWQEGQQQGWQEGQRQGWQQGSAGMLKRFLQARFGVLDAELSARIDAATTEQLEQWMDRALGAASLRELFPGAV